MHFSFSKCQKLSKQKKYPLQKRAKTSTMARDVVKKVRWGKMHYTPWKYEPSLQELLQYVTIPILFKQQQIILLLSFEKY